ncbi:MAG TPA: FKBP-type peptidyl-prolyl cis-trans isomerase [Bacteroidia bacterium]|jgi:FKBP-type peptidyl-prolyl cis-trans isomerase FkpA|nr:FKBP-type peptidyl-prolyl cis-trans isomerase [Bacteroidia bacterium]
MKKTLFILAVVVLAASCKDNSKFPGYDATETGAFFRMDKASDEKAEIAKGDVIFMHHTMTTDKDSLLYDYKTMTRPGQPYAMRLSPSVYKGDMFEMIYKLHKGDSASFALRIDSMFERYYHQPIPKFLDAKGYIIYHVKIDSVYSSAKVDEIEKKNKVMQEAFMEKARLAEDSTMSKYIADNKITVKPTESGLYIVIKEKGKGAKVKAGDNVEVNYKGMLTNGQVFDASDKHEQAFVFQVGSQGIVPAWSEGITGMTVGTKATLVCPSKLGWGPQGSGPIPPFAVTVFEIEVIGIKAAPPAGPTTPGK